MPKLKKHLFPVITFFIIVFVLPIIPNLISTYLYETGLQRIINMTSFLNSWINWSIGYALFAGSLFYLIANKKELQKTKTDADKKELQTKADADMTVQEITEKYQLSQDQWRLNMKENFLHILKSLNQFDDYIRSHSGEKIADVDLVKELSKTLNIILEIKKTYD